MANERFAIGIDLGGTRIKGVLICENGHVLQKLTHPTLSDENERTPSGDTWKQAIFELVQKLKECHPQGPQEIKAIGLAAPGLPNETNDRILHMPGRLRGLEQFEWGAFLDVKEASLSVLNDAQAALVAESSFGSGQGIENIILLTLGTGVGGAILINGELYQGNIQRAGHFGHISLNTSGPLGITGTPGSLEEAIGNATLTDRSLGEYDSTRELVDAFKAGDSFAAWVWLNSVRNLSIGISSLINALSPELVILGGGIAQADEALFDPLERFLMKYEWQPDRVRTPVKKATFHHFAGAMGAAMYSLKYGMH
ncbi:MAG: ROK family protein [Balneolaceae bacterium]